MPQCRQHSIFSLLPFRHILHLMRVLNSLRLELAGPTLDIVLQV